MLLVSEWADQFRVLSPKSADEPGRWRTQRTPYLQEIMDCLSVSSPVQRVVFMKGAQVGGTEAGNNWIGYVIHMAPGPMMAVSPTVEMAKRNSRQRIDPQLEDVPELRARVAPARSRDSGNTVLSKEFPGGVLVMTGANSAVGLRSMPARYLFMDEVDGYPGDVEGEGDPILLAERRSATFARRRKVLLVSTPTLKSTSRIQREFENSDQRYFYVPCPSCGHSQPLRFSQLRWEEGKPENAQYCCEDCDFLISEHQKTEMLNQGYWQATAEGDGQTQGYYLSSLYSPVVAIKGRDTETALIQNVSKADTGGKRRGLRVWNVSGPVAKVELYRWLKLPRPMDEEHALGELFSPGTCHFPQYGEEYFKQLTAERRIIRLHRGFPKATWEKDPTRNNEALDCRVYARAAASIYGLDRFKELQWKRLENALGEVKQSTPVKSESAQPIAKKTTKAFRQRSSVVADDPYL